MTGGIADSQGLAAFAQKVVRCAIAFMAVTTIAATVVGFWLSYAGLHSFALRSGLHGAEAWAWPAAIDLFILAGELGITISAIRRKRDPMAWGYLFAGFGPSVVFNVLHVATITPSWGRYAVAAVPPVAAMLALAALMRQVFRLAVEAHIAGAREDAPAGQLVTELESAPALNGRVHPARARERSRTRTRRAPVSGGDAEREFTTELASGALPSLRLIRSRLHVGQDRARQLRAYLEIVTSRT